MKRNVDYNPVKKIDKSFLTLLSEHYTYWLVFVGEQWPPPLHSSIHIIKIQTISITFWNEQNTMFFQYQINFF